MATSKGKGIVTEAAMKELFDKQYKNQRKKGKNLLESHHILSFNYDADFKHLSGKVRSRQTKSLSYHVSIFWKGAKIDHVTCSCVRGQKHCGHIAPLLVYAKKNISCTDVSCSWVRPKIHADEEQETYPLDHLYPTQKQYSAIDAVNPEIWVRVAEKLSNCGDAAAGVRFLLAEEPERPTECISVVEVFKLINSEDFRLAENKIGFLESKLKVTTEEISAIEKATKDQYKNPLWGKTREYRLTSSNYGPILNVIGRTPPPSLMDKLTNRNTSQSAQFHATKWGQDNEVTAIKQFEKKYNLQVKRSGLWLHSCGYLAGSPDGLVGHNCIVEVKCPYRWRNVDLEEALKVDKLECLYTKKRLTLKKDTYVAYFYKGDWHINENHDYYQQIQGNLYITQRDYCYLILWTTKSLVCLKLDKDVQWGKKSFPALSSFYFDVFVPYVASLKR